MYILLWLQIFVCIYSTSGLHLNERINDDLIQVKCALEDDPRFQLILAHPYDCSKYFLCNNGDANLGVCPMGLHFSNSRQICDYPEEVGCDRDKIQVKKLLSESSSSVECPSVDGTMPTYLPHPSDCGKFYICHVGVPHLKSCLPGLHFNVNLKVCDYPNRAECTQSKQMSQMTPKQESPGVPSPLCPTLDGKEQTFFNHPSNCSEYYMCSHGFAYKFACPARLHFNLKTKACDYETQAYCQADNS